MNLERCMISRRSLESLYRLVWPRRLLRNPLRFVYLSKFLNLWDSDFNRDSDSLNRFKYSFRFMNLNRIYPTLLQTASSPYSGHFQPGRIQLSMTAVGTRASRFARDKLAVTIVGVGLESWALARDHTTRTEWTHFPKHYLPYAIALFNNQYTNRYVPENQTVYSLTT